MPRMLGCSERSMPGNRHSQIRFLEISTDKDGVHFLVGSIPTYSVTKLVAMIKSITAREIFKRCPQVKKKLWGGEFGQMAILQSRQQGVART